MVRTSDGREYEVPHPEFVLIGNDWLALQDEEGEHVFLDSDHVVALKDLPVKKNGAKRKR